MPEVPARVMYARAPEGHGVLVGAAGVTDVGVAVAAYVPTRRGAVYASGTRVYGVGERGTPVDVGPVGEQGVLFQVDPTMRYVVWPVMAGRGRLVRTLVYDVAAQRIVLDRLLAWSAAPGTDSAVASFGVPSLRLVRVEPERIWSFATRSGRLLVLPTGRVFDLRGRAVPGASRDGGIWSPGLRYRAIGRGGHLARVVDARSGHDLTPAHLPGSPRAALWFGRWLGPRNFSVTLTSGTWRHALVRVYDCRTAGRCTPAFRYRLGAADGGLSSSSEIG